MTLLCFYEHLLFKHFFLLYCSTFSLELHFPVQLVSIFNLVEFIKTVLKLNGFILLSKVNTKNRFFEKLQNENHFESDGLV